MSADSGIQSHPMLVDKRMPQPVTSGINKLMTYRLKLNGAKSFLCFNHDKKYSQNPHDYSRDWNNNKDFVIFTSFLTCQLGYEMIDEGIAFRVYVLS